MVVLMKIPSMPFKINSLFSLEFITKEKPIWLGRTIEMYNANSKVFLSYIPRVITCSVIGLGLISGLVLYRKINSIVAKKDAVLAEMSTAMDKIVSEKNGLETENTRKNDKLKAENNTLIAEVKELIAARDKSEKLVAEKEADIVKKENGIAEKDALLAQQESKITEKEEIIAKLRGILKKVKDEILSDRKKIESLEEKIKSLEAKKGEKKAIRFQMDVSDIKDPKKSGEGGESG